MIIQENISRDVISGLGSKWERLNIAILIAILIAKEIEGEKNCFHKYSGDCM